MFFYYCFSDRFGHDQVCWDESEYGQPGDLLQANGAYFIALGDTVSWQAMYEHLHMRFEMRNVQIHTRLFSKKTLQLVHWMTYYYYTSYKSIVHLFIADIFCYFKVIQKVKTMKQKDRSAHNKYNTIAGLDLMTYQSQLVLDTDSEIGQTLVVFPDLLSLKYRMRDGEYILGGQDTVHKITKYYYDLQQGYKNILITTGANICMDYKSLSQIICYFPQTWYYKSQQNPRYHIVEILEKMSQLWKANLQYIDVV